MPSRVLREGILDSRAVNSLSEEAELFYWHLLLVVDDYGRIEADPEILSVKCFPRRYVKFDSQMTGRCLTDVSTVLTDDGQPLVTLYTVGNKKYLQVNNFNQRMRAHKSRCPSPDGQMPVTCLTDDGHATALARACASSESEAESDIGVGHRTSESDQFRVFRTIYALTGKPVNEGDWMAAFVKWISLDLDAEADAIMEYLNALIGTTWKDNIRNREHQYIPAPVNWLRKKPWTRQPEAIARYQ